MKLLRLEKKADGESMSGFLGLTGPVKFRYNKVNGNNIDGFPSFVLQCAASQQKIRRREAITFIWSSVSSGGFSEGRLKRELSKWT